MIARALVIAALAASSGCFKPTYNDLQCGANGECPSGFTCVANACQRGDGVFDADPDGHKLPFDANVTDCASMGKSPTTITGTIYAPNGTLPLPNIDVYVAATDPGAHFSSQVSCIPCNGDALPGNPVVQTRTRVDGSFMLPNVPDGDNVRVVITTGKWRRQLLIPHIDACSTIALDMPSSRLPNSLADTGGITTSVDMPHIALSTGGADAMECLLRKIGIADPEFGTANLPTAVHLFTDASGGGGQGASKFGAINFAASTTLWGITGTPPALLDYDLVMLSCEGSQAASSKDVVSMGNMKQYADSGGRIMMSHYHNIWIEGVEGGTAKPPVWPAIATFNSMTTNPPDPTTDKIVEDTPVKMTLADWMVGIGGSTTHGQVTLSPNSARLTALSVDATKAEPWVTYQSGTTLAPQIFEFSTPNEMPKANRCGRVAFSDMHVSQDSTSNPTNPFPSGCSTAPLSPQEKVLAYVFFDIGQCVGGP